MKRSTVFAGLVVGALLASVNRVQAQSWGKTALIGQEQVQIFVLEPPQNQESRKSEYMVPSRPEVQAFVKTVCDATRTAVGSNSKYISIVEKIRELHVNLGVSPFGDGYFDGVHFDTTNKALDVSYSDSPKFNSLRDDLSAALQDLITPKPAVKPIRGSLDNDKPSNGWGDINHK
jgi:hypothetical protein